MVKKKKNAPILVRSEDEFQNGGLEIRQKSFQDGTNLHWHDYYELEVITGGSGSYYINGVEFPLQRGSAYLVSPVDFHLIKGDFQLYNVAFKETAVSEDVLERIVSSASASVVLFDEDEFSFLENTLAELCRESTDTALLQERAMRCLLDYLLVHYLRKIESAEEEKNRSDIVVMRAVSYIKFHFKKKLTLAEVADAVGLTPNYVGEIFAKRMGVSFNVYLMQTRLNYAKTLLMRGDCTVEDVATLSGFASQTYFSDCFKKQFGMTPTAVKKRAAHGILFSDDDNTSADMT